MKKRAREKKKKSFNYIRLVVAVLLVILLPFAISGLNTEDISDIFTKPVSISYANSECISEGIECGSYLTSDGKSINCGDCGCCADCQDNKCVDKYSEGRCFESLLYEGYCCINRYGLEEEYEGPCECEEVIEDREYENEYNYGYGSEYGNEKTEKCDSNEDCPIGKKCEGDIYAELGVEGYMKCVPECETSDDCSYFSNSLIQPYCIEGRCVPAEELRVFVSEYNYPSGYGTSTSSCSGGSCSTGSCIGGNCPSSGCSGGSCPLYSNCKCKYLGQIMSGDKCVCVDPLKEVKKYFVSAPYYNGFVEEDFDCGCKIGISEEVRGVIQNRQVSAMVCSCPEGVVGQECDKCKDKNAIYDASIKSCDCKEDYVNTKDGCVCKNGADPDNDCKEPKPYKIVCNSWYELTGGDPLENGYLPNSRFGNEDEDNIMSCASGFEYYKHHCEKIPKEEACKEIESITCPEVSSLTYSSNYPSDYPSTYSDGYSSSYPPAY